MWWAIIAFGIFASIILWQLATGIALDEKWRSCRRVENPRKYWWIVGGQIVSVLILWVVWSFLVR